MRTTGRWTGGGCAFPPLRSCQSIQMSGTSLSRPSMEGLYLSRRVMNRYVHAAWGYIVLFLMLGARIVGVHGRIRRDKSTTAAVTTSSNQEARYSRPDATGPRSILGTLLSRKNASASQSEKVLYICKSSCSKHRQKPRLRT